MKILPWPGLQLLLTSKTYIADISYKNYFFYYICLKNVIKYIMLCIMFKFILNYCLNKDVIKKIRIWAQVFGTEPRARVITFTNHPNFGSFCYSVSEEKIFFRNNQKLVLLYSSLRYTVHSKCINDHTLRSDIFLPKCPTNLRVNTL